MLIFISIVTILIACALAQGFNEGHFFRIGLSSLRFDDFNFHLGVTFEPTQTTDSKGDIYYVKSLKVGFIIFIVWIDFYNHIGSNKVANDITAESTPATV